MCACSMFCLSVSCYTGTIPKHLLSNGVLQTQDFLCFQWCSKRLDFVPHVCIVYIGDLSNTLNRAGTGCHIHNCCISHVFYADDSCVTAASPSTWASGFAEHLYNV